jgi:hypothetical protein
MVNNFKVQDPPLVDQIFSIADVNHNGSIDIRELLGNLLFWLRGDLDVKFELFFEIFGSVNDGFYVDTPNIIKIIEDAMHIFKETFFVSKVACDKMNLNLDGRISF